MESSESIEEKVANLPKDSGGVFSVGDIVQIRGLVLEKDDEERMLTLKVEDGEKKVKVAADAKFTTVYWDVNGNDHTIMGDFWGEIVPQVTSIVGVCKDETCEKITSVFLNRLPE